MKICFVGSSGGHLFHLYLLKPFWQDKERFWVTFEKEDAISLLKGERMYYCYGPSNRSMKALVINSFRALNILRKERPDLIISTGAAPAVPLFLVWEAHGCKDHLSGSIRQDRQAYSLRKIMLSCSRSFYCTMGRNEAGISESN